MRYIDIDSVEPGQYLGKTIFSNNGTVLLNAGVQLTVYMINTLRRIGVDIIFIKDVEFEDIELEEIITDETKQVIIRRMEESFKAIQSGKEFNARTISISVDQLLDDVMRNKDVLIQLSDIRTKDNGAYVHAMNVCMMSTMVGMNLDLNPMQLKELALGGLLHDIGKVLSGESDVDGERSKDMLRHHTWRGFELLKMKREYSLLTAHVAFQHHETPDGKGVPRGLDDEQIHLYAKIVAVANTYDNLLYNATTNVKMLPHEACEHMMALSGTKLDREVLIQFLKIVSIYPIGSSVKLSTREMGVVVGQHRGLPGRPVVRIIKSEQDDELVMKDVDLATETTVFIEAVVS